MSVLVRLSVTVKRLVRKQLLRPTAAAWHTRGQPHAEPIFNLPRQAFGLRQRMPPTLAAPHVMFSCGLFQSAMYIRLHPPHYHHLCQPPVMCLHYPSRRCPNNSFCFWSVVG